MKEGVTMILRIPFFILILVSLKTAFTATSTEDDVGKVVFCQRSFDPTTRSENYINATFESEELSIRRYGNGIFDKRKSLGSPSEIGYE
jgi:hypothetical protein